MEKYNVFLRSIFAKLCDDDGLGVVRNELRFH